MLKKSGKTVIPLDNCPPESVCVTMTGLVTKEDHTIYFRDYIADLTQKNGTVKVLINFDENFQGWDPGAADASWRSILDFAAKAQKVAYINPPDKRILLHKLSGALFPGEVKFFNKGELDQALEWLAA